MEAIKYSLLSSLNDEVLGAVFENSIVSITDSLGRIEYVNSKFCKILDCNANKLVGETHELLKSPLHSDRVYKNLWRTIKMGNKWNGVLADFSKTGNPFWLDTTIIPLINEDQKSVKYLAIYKDVTKYHEKNIKLLQDDLANKKFLKKMPLNVFTISRYGKILNANKRFCDNKVNDLIDTYLYDYFSPEIFEYFKQNIDKACVDKLTHEFELYDFDTVGEKKFFSVVVSPNFDEIGVVISATIALYKITKLKSSSNKLIDTEAKFRAIYQSINVGIIVVADDKGNITEWNKGAEAAFGYEKEEIIGRSLTVLMSDKYRKGNITQLKKAVNRIKNKQNVDVVEMCCLSSDGKQFPVEFALSSGVIGDSSFYCAMMLDITKRKLLENKLKVKTKDLELFLYRSAHDLKAPFSSAEGLLGLLKEEKVSEEKELLMEMLDTVVKDGKELSESLSQASNILINKTDIKKINFTKAIDDVLVSLKGAEKFSNINFKVNVIDAYGFHSYKEKIKYILQNLIKNAIKYSANMEGLESSYVNITVRTNQKEAVIIVEDNGVGIHKKKLHKIFELYYRANRFNEPGHGLGLYVVKNIVNELKGEINVESSVGNGACFEIVLPNSI